MDRKVKYEIETVTLYDLRRIVVGGDGHEISRGLVSRFPNKEEAEAYRNQIRETEGFPVE